MMSIRTLSLAVVSLLATAPAFAQEAVTAETETPSSTSTAVAEPGRATNSTTNGDADAAYRRFAATGGVALMKPSNDPLSGSNVDVDGGSAPTLSASWYATPNIAVELWGAADKFNHRVKDGGAKIGTIEQQPIALSAQYHFGTADQVFRPFLGLGYYESNFSNEDIAGGGSHVAVETARGPIATAGLDFNITPTWFARTDVRYMKADPELRVGGVGTGEELNLDPWTAGVSIGARF